MEVPSPEIMVRPRTVSRCWRLFHVAASIKFKFFHPSPILQPRTKRLPLSAPHDTFRIGLATRRSIGRFGAWPSPASPQCHTLGRKVSMRSSIAGEPDLHTSSQHRRLHSSLSLRQFIGDGNDRNGKSRFPSRQLREY